MEKFIDLCILCGCDYTTNIPGIGPIKAYNYIDCYENIENTLVKIEHENENPYKKKKHHIPETFMFKEARDLFKNPNVIKDVRVLDNQLKWTKPDENGMKEFLV